MCPFVRRPPEDVARGPAAGVSRWDKSRNDAASAEGRTNLQKPATAPSRPPWPRWWMRRPPQARQAPLRVRLAATPQMLKMSQKTPQPQRPWGGPAAARAARQEGGFGPPGCGAGSRAAGGVPGGGSGARPGARRCGGPISRPGRLGPQRGPCGAAGGAPAPRRARPEPCDEGAGGLGAPGRRCWAAALPWRQPCAPTSRFNSGSLGCRRV